MGDILIPLFAIFFLFGGPVIAFIVVRVLRHQERMELLRRGIIPPDQGWGGRRGWYPGQTAWQQQQAQQQPGRPPFRAGPWPGACGSDDDDPQRILFKGIRLALIGLAILIGLSFIGGTPGTPDFHGGPWLLGGLIPMFVGVAQIIIAVLSGAQLPGVQPGATIIPPPPGPVAPPPPPTGPREQPGRQRLEELSKPVPPPDVR